MKSFAYFIGFIGLYSVFKIPVLILFKYLPVTWPATLAEGFAYLCIYILISVLFMKIFGFKSCLKREYISFSKIYQFFLSLGGYIAVCIGIEKLWNGAVFTGHGMGYYILAFLSISFAAFGEILMFVGCLYSCFQSVFSKLMSYIALASLTGICGVITMAAAAGKFGIEYFITTFWIYTIVILLFERTKSLWVCLGLYIAEHFLSETDLSSGVSSVLVLTALFIYLLIWLKRSRNIVHV